MNVICQICNKSFKTIPAKIKQGNGKFCSRKCYGIFKKGKTSWNKGLHIQTNTGRTHFKKGQQLNEKNPNWKGDNAGYLAIHTWIIRKLNFPKVCKICGKIPKKIEVANIDHKYRRKISDYIPMCTSCHRKYDFKQGLIFFNLSKFKFKIGMPPPSHKIGCKCFRCTKIPWNKGKFNHHKSLQR